PECRDSTEFLHLLLLDCARFDVRVCESPTGLSAPTLSPFDAVVDACQQSSLGEETEKALEGFVRSGGGLIVTRGGLAFLPSAAARGSASGQLSRLLQLPEPTNRDAVAEALFHRFELKSVLPKHPVMATLPALHTADQPLLGITLETEAEVLATTDKDEPVLFVSNHGKGRVFCTALGLDVGAMQEKAFITTFLRGSGFAASGQETL